MEITSTPQWDSGKLAEQAFADLVAQPVIKADKRQDIQEHWDLKDAQGIKYDVKAMKRWKRSDPDPTDRMHFVELRNVNGELGWIYGLADYIVFETRSYWLLVSRKRLCYHIEASIDGEIHDSPKVYRLYQRKDRNDLMTVVPTVDLLAISEQVIRKTTTTK